MILPTTIFMFYVLGSTLYCLGSAKYLLKAFDKDIKQLLNILPIAYVFTEGITSAIVIVIMFITIIIRVNVLLSHKVYLKMGILL